jgi:hypothetical protein
MSDIRKGLQIFELHIIRSSMSGLPVNMSFLKNNSFTRIWIKDFLKLISFLGII